MMPPEQAHLIGQWTEKADEDYTNAEYTLTLQNNCPLSTVCFHSQQCVEKYLKALLIGHSLPVPKSHDLLELYHRLSSDERPSLSEEWLAILNRYAVEARYPGDWDAVSRREAEDAFAAAGTIRRTISAELLRMLNPCEDS
jgi:HEPN domain-containing protein